MITPPLSISARPALTRKVASSRIGNEDSPALDCTGVQFGPSQRSTSCIIEHMDDLLDMSDPDRVAYTLDLTPAQLKVTHSALKSMLDDFGHEERDVLRVIREVLAKLPDEASIRAIDLAVEERRRRLT